MQGMKCDWKNKPDFWIEYLSTLHRDKIEFFTSAVDVWSFDLQNRHTLFLAHLQHSQCSIHPSKDDLTCSTKSLRSLHLFLLFPPSLYNNFVRFFERGKNYSISPEWTKVFAENNRYSTQKSKTSGAYREVYQCQ